jgi:NAD(P)-dependent dehydrogenase (short-subunit alcohol dehydrogenase family)
MSAAHAAIAAKKLAVITGGASGIGLATATALYKQGMNVAIGDVSNELDEAVEKIKASVNNSSSASNRIWAGSVDVSEVKSVEAFQSKVQE